MKNKISYLKKAVLSKHWEKRKTQALAYYKLLKKIDNNLTGKKILDVGCAEGVEVNEFQKLGLIANGVDIKNEFIDEAKIRFPKNTFAVGSAEKLPYQNKSFDIVFSINTLFYTNIEKSIPEFCRILKNDGRGIISFDTEIINLDEKKVFHTDSIEHLCKILKKFNALIEYCGKKEKRIDMDPFKHRHTFYKIIFRKI